MKTKIEFLLLIFFTCICTAIAVFCTLKSMILFSILFLLVAVIVLCASVGMILYRRFMQKRIIDPKKNLKRNYDRILLGEMSRQEVVNDNVLDLRGYHRNAYTDVLLTERYYSFLKQNGCIDIFVTNTHYYYYSKTINPIDYPILHPVTLRENGIPERSYRFVLHNPIIGLKYILFRIDNLLNRRKKATPSVDFFEKVSNFCEIRKVYLDIH